MQSLPVVHSNLFVHPSEGLTDITPGHYDSYSHVDSNEDTMRTVQMTLEDGLVKAVDQAARKLRTSRSGFTRRALCMALERLRIEDLERKHREGYKREPVRSKEFCIWEEEQVWGEP